MPCLMFFISLDEDSVLERFSRWGGVPRYVLAKIQESDQKILEDAVPSVTLDKLREYVASGRVTGDDDFSHRLLHLKIRGEVDEGLSNSQAGYYIRFRGELASKYVAELVHNHLEKVGKENLRAFIWDSSGISSLAALTGQLFEAEAIKRMANGGNFSRRNLSSNITDSVPFSATSTRSFSSVEELSRNHGANNMLIHVPASKSFCAIDAVLPRGVPANMTLNSQHRIYLEGQKQPGLVEIARSLGYGEVREVPFYWVVPDGLFSSFRARSFVGPDRKVVKNDTFAKRVVQYVLRIDKRDSTAGTSGDAVNRSNDVATNNDGASGAPGKRRGHVVWHDLPSESRSQRYDNVSVRAPVAQMLGGSVGRGLVCRLAGTGRAAVQGLMRRMR